MNKHILAAALLAGSMLIGLAQSRGQTPPPAPRPFQLISMDPAFDKLIAPGTKLETIVTIPGLSGEGPLWRHGKLRLSDQKGGPIYEVSLDGTYKVLVDKAGGPIDPAVTVNQGPNGEAAFKYGTILVARQGLRDIGIMDKDGKIGPFLSAFEGKRFNSPNDIAASKDGTVWFTDPTYSLPRANQAPGAGPPPDKQIPFQGVFRLKDAQLSAVIADMGMPNGIGLSPDGKTLYVDNDRPDMSLRAYDVGKDEELSNGREIARIPADTPYGRGVPDGLKVDSLGNIWMTGPGGLIVFAPSGKILGRVQLPANATNMAFGADYKSLFITSGPNVYRLKTLVKGLVLPFTE